MEETWQKNKFNSDYLFETKRKAKVMKKILLTIFTAVILLSVLAGCNESDPQLSDNAAVTNRTEGTTDKVTNEAPTETTDAVTGNVTDNGDNDSLSAEVFIPEDFVYPGTDGSTSTTNLEKAVKKAIFGSEQPVKHSKTYQAFNNLLEKPREYKLIFTTPLSETQIQQMEEKGYKYEAEPVAGEGFVFVVNKNNPVDTLTVEQLKGIYSGKITNWSQVGGNDAKIVAYQRNADSGSQNYMISFMGDTPLMAPNTDTIPASMGQILDVVANYDNAVDAIGYSVYAYSDGMYENISEIKYIKVNGVEPSLKTLADGTYPLLGYNYAVFSAEEPEDSDVRLLVKWIQSDAGQQVVTDAGYVPYRKVEGLTLPDPTSRELYTAEASSEIKKPDMAEDHYYQTVIDEDYFDSAVTTPLRGYDIFMSRCDKGKKKNTPKLVKTVSGGTATAWTKSKLKKKKCYKVYVQAWKMENGAKTYIAKSPLVHVYTTGKSGKYTNPKAVTVDKTDVILNTGGSHTIKAKVSKLKKGKKLMPKTHTKTLRYVSSNPDVAAVSGSGQITAKAPGTCTVYVYAANGASKIVNVTVK